jgi:type I site-specific restriction endonuclease
MPKNSAPTIIKRQPTEIKSKIKKKTLVVVHKSFLLNQWKERINQFLPNANVGLIQGPIIDVENKDIVIGMLQTLYSRTFDSSIYSQFGFTIIDEVHRIGSEQFSKALFKLFYIFWFNPLTTFVSIGNMSHHPLCEQTLKRLV